MITFVNPGAIDLLGLKNFGLSSKSKSQIGRFGTGLKYAIGVIVRHGGIVRIWADGQWNTIGTRTETFRGEKIQQITMNGSDLPFTSDLGRDWEPWMAFRELYANALDEGGDVTRPESAPEPDVDETVIAVELDAFEAIYDTMEEHFLPKAETPIWSSVSLDIYEGRSTFVFHNGIAVHRLKKPAAYRYNIKGALDLTEDRTAKYSFEVMGNISLGLAKCDVEEVCRNACDQGNEFEATLDFSRKTEVSQAFLGAASSAGANCNPTAVALLRSKLPTDASLATVVAKGAPGAKCLSNALSTLRKLGADLSKAKFVLAEGVNIYGDADVRGDAVFLSEGIFDDQEKMTIAVVRGYGLIIGDNWMARTLIQTVDGGDS